MVESRLPRQYLFELATPLVVYNGELLQAAESRGDVGYIDLGSRRYGLVHIAQPRILEDLFLAHNSEAVYSFKQEAAQEYSDREYVSVQEMQSREGQNRVISLILDRILPQLSGDVYNNRLAEALQEGSGSGGNTRNNNSQHRQEESNGLETQVEEFTPEMQRQARRMVQRVTSEVAEEYEKYRLPSDSIDNRVMQALAGEQDGVVVQDDSVLFELAGTNKMMLMGDSLYRLERIKDFIGYFEESIESTLFEEIMRAPDTKKSTNVLRHLEENRDRISHRYYSRIVNKIAGSKVKVAGRYYLPLLWDSSSELEHRYDKLMQKHLIIGAIQETLTNDRRLYELAEQNRRLDEIARTGQYEHNGAGLFRKDGQWHVYMRIPPYALKSPHVPEPKCYVPFDGVTLAVPLTQRGGQSDAFSIGVPRVVESYRHPFMGESRPYSTICYGEWNPERVLRSHLPTEQKVVRLLNQSKETLMMGYRRGSNPYIPLSKGNWSRWMDKNEVDRRGLVCLNDFGRGRNES